jgi:hypothetical protein
VLEEVTPLAVVTTIRYLDLLAVHVVLNLMVPHSLPMGVVPINSLHGRKEPHPRSRNAIWIFVTRRV